jgi:hypothetical protein
MELILEVEDEKETPTGPGLQLRLNRSLILSNKIISA